MTAKQTVFLTEDRTKAVPAGHPNARFLLVREGLEIEPSQFEHYEGAAALIKGKKAEHEEEPEPKKIEPLRKKH